MRAAPAFVIIVLGCLFLASCAPPQPDMTALRKTVDEFNAATKDAMLSGNSDKVMTYYEDTALEMAPNMALVTGKAAIKEFQDKMFHSGMKITAAAFKTLELEAGGKIAYEVGTYEMSITMPQGGEMKDQGKYIAIWRHQTNGSWKVHAETWNSNMPLPPMEPQEGKKDETKGKK